MGRCYKLCVHERNVPVTLSKTFVTKSEMSRALFSFFPALIHAAAAPSVISYAAGEMKQTDWHSNITINPSLKSQLNTSVSNTSLRYRWNRNKTS